MATGKRALLAHIPGACLFAPVARTDPDPAQEVPAGDLDYAPAVAAIRTCAAASSTGKAVLKIVARDKVCPPAHLTVDAGTTDENIVSQINEWCGDFWTIYRLGTSPDAYLVQEHVPMELEYRIFIVDGFPVTGAGCVEEHTPLNNTGKRFDEQVRQLDFLPALKGGDSRVQLGCC